MQANEGDVGGLANPPGNPPVPGNNHEPGQEAASAGGGDGEGAGGRAGEENPAAAAANRPNWWGFLKEVQMIVVGFVTSLLPGYQHVE